MRTHGILVTPGVYYLIEMSAVLVLFQIGYLYVSSGLMLDTTTPIFPRILVLPGNIRYCQINLMAGMTFIVSFRIVMTGSPGALACSGRKTPAKIGSSPIPDMAKTRLR